MTRTPALGRRVAHSWKVIAAVAAVLCADSSSAGVREAFSDGIREFTLDVENDSFLTTDHFYTNGLRLAYRLTEREVTRLADKRLAATTYGIHLANNMYTPSDISIPAELLQDGDRPYAGWTYLGFMRERTFGDDSFERVELDLGCIGPCSGTGTIQIEWHEFLEIPEPQGWDSQVGNQAVVQGIYQRRFASLAYPKGDPLSDALGIVDLAPSVGASLGNLFVTGEAGVTARLSLGRMLSYASGSGISGSMPKGRILRSKAPVPTVELDPSSGPFLREVFVYARAGVRYVLHNATIEGRWFASDVFTQDARPWVFDTELGAAVHFRRASITVAYAMRSSEIEEREFSLGTHRWLEVRLGIRF